MSLSELVKSKLTLTDCNKSNFHRKNKHDQALAEAERLADLYRDIKPDVYLTTSKHLFSMPKEHDPNFLNQKNNNL